jgi:hypothetical protein
MGLNSLDPFLWVSGATFPGGFLKVVREWYNRINYQNEGILYEPQMLNFIGA